MAHFATKIVIAWVVCSLLIATGFVFIFSPPSANAVLLQSPTKVVHEYAIAEVVAGIGPSPFLLFSMGALGIGCVLINERLRKRYSSAEMQSQHDVHI